MNNVTRSVQRMVVAVAAVTVLGGAAQVAHAKIMVAAEAPRADVATMTPVSDEALATLAVELAAGEAVVRAGKGGQLQLVKVSPTLAALGFAAGDVILSVDGAPLRARELPERLRSVRAAGGFAVQLKRGKVQSELRFAFGAGARAASSTPVAPVAPVVVKDLGGGKLEVKRAELLRALDDGAAARSARMVPSLRDGKPAGVKLYAIRPGSVFAQLGFKNGDTLRSVNGVSLDGVQQFELVHASLTTAKALVVEIDRAGAPTTITIVLVD